MDVAPSDQLVVIIFERSEVWDPAPSADFAQAGTAGPW